MAIILKGMEVVNQMKEGQVEQVASLSKQGILPCLGIVRIGARPDDLSYERGARKRCDSVGIKSVVFEFPEDISQEAFVAEFKKINGDKNVHGILLFRPLPKHLNEAEIKQLIHPNKDIDCLSAQNIAKVFEGDESGFPPCTAQGVMEILEAKQIELEGRNVVVLGRSMVVGKPLAMMLLKKNATVSICHTKTKNLKEICKGAEILIVAVGKAKVLNHEFVSPGTVVIDVGINVDEAGALCGDVDFESVEALASHISPVPGGVGTVTSSVLAKHVIWAAQKAGPLDF